MNAITKLEPSHAPALSVNPMTPQNLEQAIRLAKIMSDMSLVPQHLQGKPADCMLIVEQAYRWKMSPFAVAQATSVLQGKLNFEGKLVAAALQTSGVLSTRLRYDYRGDGDGREVMVSATVVGEATPREVLVKLREVKTGNKMWVSQPDQQLSYAGARIWARRHAPEVMLGVYSPEEFSDLPEPPHQGKTVDHTPIATAQAATIPDMDAPPPPPPSPTNAIKERLERCTSQDDVIRVGEGWRKSVDGAQAAGRPFPAAITDIVQDLLADAMGQWPAVIEHEVEAVPDDGTIDADAIPF